MAPRPGRALLAAALPGQFMLFFLSPLASWGLVAAALLLCRRDPELRQRVPAAFGVLLLCVAGTLAGLSLTVGTAEGALFSIGEPAADAPLAVVAFASVAAAPAAVVLAASRDPTVRGLARAALVLFAAAVLIDLATFALGPGSADATGTYPQQRSLLLVSLLLAHALVLGALAAPPARDAYAWMRRKAAVDMRPG